MSDEEDTSEAETEHAAKTRHLSSQDLGEEKASDKLDIASVQTRHLPTQEPTTQTTSSEKINVTFGDLSRLAAKSKHLTTQEHSIASTNKSYVSSLAFPDLVYSYKSVEKTQNAVSCPAKQLSAQPTKDKGVAVKLNVKSPFSLKDFTEKTKKVVKSSSQQSAVSVPARHFPSQKAKTITRPLVIPGKKSTPLRAEEHLYAKPIQSATNPKHASEDNLEHDDYDDESGDSRYSISEDWISDEESDCSDQNFTPNSKDSLCIDLKGASTSEEKVPAKPKPLSQTILDQLATIQIHDIVQCFLCPSKLMGSLGYVAHLAVKHQINTQTKLQVKLV